MAFLAFIAVAVLLLRKDSLRSLSDSWAMRKCPDFVQADLSLLLPFTAPKVVRCEGSPAQATCFIETTEKTGRKTAPVKNWDCTKQHLSPDAVNDIMGVGFQGSAEKLERMQKAKQDVLDSVQYVTARLRERSELLGEQ
jgi:hypothetical protein